MSPHPFLRRLPRLVAALTTALAVGACTGTPGTSTDVAATEGALRTATAPPTTAAGPGTPVLTETFDATVEGWEQWWNPSQLGVVTTARTGSGALAVTAASGQATAFQKTDALVATHRHRLSFWVRGTGGIAAQVIQFDDQWSPTNTIQLPALTLPAEMPGDWIRYEAIFGVAASTAHANLAVAADGSALLLDDVTVEDLGPLFVDVPARSAPNTGPWQPLWADEFDGGSLDTTRWSADNAPTDFNGELHCYTPRPENLSVSGGMLHLTARRESNLPCPDDARFPGGRSYSSALLRSTSTLREGRVEIRAKVPAGKGLWPALWLLPKDAAKYKNGRNGEIDIVEVIGDTPDVAHFSIHYDYTKAVDGEGKKTASVQRPFKLSDDFHVYAIEWDTDEIRWYLDGDQLFRSGADENPWFTPPDAAWPAPFDQELYVILNLAVGGSWPGEPAADTPFPATMDVDYVRVSQRAAS